MRNEYRPSILQARDLSVEEWRFLRDFEALMARMDAMRIAPSDWLTLSGLAISGRLGLTSTSDLFEAAAADLVRASLDLRADTIADG